MFALFILLAFFASPFIGCLYYIIRGVDEIRNM
jgi:hypothetical protein